MARNKDEALKRLERKQQVVASDDPAKEATALANAAEDSIDTFIDNQWKGGTIAFYSSTLFRQKIDRDLVHQIYLLLEQRYQTAGWEVRLGNEKIPSFNLSVPAKRN